ncbi:MAG TPA: archaeosortase/exosortase family protein, partial [Phycisphaerae bacterium]
MTTATDTVLADSLGPSAASDALPSSQTRTGRAARSVRSGVLLTVLIISLVWSFAPVISGLLRDWHTNDNYSVGQLVPLAAIYLLWQERRRLTPLPMQPSYWGAL